MFLSFLCQFFPSSFLFNIFPSSHREKEIQRVSYTRTSVTIRSFLPSFSTLVSRSILCREKILLTTTKISFLLNLALTLGERHSLRLFATRSVCVCVFVSEWVNGKCGRINGESGERGRRNEIFILLLFHRCSHSSIRPPTTRAVAAKVKFLLFSSHPHINWSHQWNIQTEIQPTNQATISALLPSLSIT